MYKHLIPRLTDDVWQCVKPKVTECDADLADKMETSMTDVKNSFSDAQYMVPDRSNSVPRLFRATSLFLSAILTFSLVLM